MDFRLPELGEGVYEAELVSWLVKPGDTVKRGQNLMEVMTDKATMEVPAPFAGTIGALKATPGTQIKVGEVVLTYEGKSDGKAPIEESRARQEAVAEQAARGGAAVSAAVQTPPKPRPTNAPGAGRAKASPSVRFMARKLGIDLASVAGSGPEGRILIEDLAGRVKPTTAGGKLPADEPRPDYGKPGTRVKLQGLRRKIAEHMVLSKRTIPHFAYVDECEVTELVRLRAALRETYERAGIKITYLSFFIKAAANALKEMPIVNASLEEGDEGETIVLHDRYNIGVAVATANGLIVPVIRDADRKDLAQIAREVERLGNEARSGKIRLEDLRGGTFTITSIGGIGGLISTPIINYPEVAILGIGKTVKRPVYDAAGNLRPADLIYLSFSFDHRVVDGAVGAAFGNSITRQLQNPAALLLPERLS